MLDVAEFLITRIETERGRRRADDGALRLVRHGHGRRPDRTDRPLADALAGGRRALDDRGMDGARQRHQPIGGAGIFGRDVGGVRAHSGLHRAADAEPGRLDRAARLGVHAGRHGPSRRLGRRCRRRRPRRPLRLAAVGPAQPAVPQQGRRHVRGHDRGGGRWASSTARRSRSSPTSTTTATRISSCVTRAGPLLFIERRQGRTSRTSRTRSSSSSRCGAR